MSKISLKKSSQAALEFLTTYGWAFLVILVMIAALSYFGILSPSKLLPDRCNFGSEISCINHLIGTDGISLRLKNNVNEPIIVNALTVSTEKAQLSCSSPLIGSLWESGEIKDIPISCDFTDSGIAQSEKGRLNLRMSYYAARSGSSFSRDVQAELYAAASSSSSGLGVSTIKVLSVYPCGCLIDDIVANYGAVSGYPPIEVTCMVYTDFNNGAYGTYQDLSNNYDVVMLDGADCWGSKNLDVEERNALKNYVSAGGGLIMGHDTADYEDWTEMYEVLGVTDGNPGWSSSTSRVLTSGSITQYPYALPSTFTIQCTHTTGFWPNAGATLNEDFNLADANDFYVISHTYGSGRAAMTEWGHCAYDCGCGLNQGMPAADESKSIINAIYWAAGVTT